MSDTVEPLPAGPFGDWLTGMQRALRGERDAEVACGSCTACCTSSQFIHVGPDETDTLARIPVELQFPAPGLPKGHVVLGYDERGHCPMFIDGACSIYDHRPRTCRTYDCRVFAATGVDLGDGELPLIAAQARRWRFAYPTPAGQRLRDDLLESVDRVRESTASGDVPGATRLAVLAIKSATQRSGL